MQGVGGVAAGYRGGPYKKWGSNFIIFFYSVQEVMRGVGSGGPSRWPKATSPQQELEVGARRAPYLLVVNILVHLI